MIKKLENIIAQLEQEQSEINTAPITAEIDNLQVTINELTMERSGMLQKQTDLKSEIELLEKVKEIIESLEEEKEK